MQAADTGLIPPTSSNIVCPGGAGDSPRVPVRPALLWALALGAGLLAGIAAWLGGEASLGIIKPPLHDVTSKGRPIRVASRHDQSVADARNAGLAFALLGGLLSAGLGVAGGLARRSVRFAAAAGLLGLIVGTAAGAGTSTAVLPFFNAYKERHPDQVSHELILPLLVHLAIWSVVGAASGLAFGVGLGERGRLPSCIVGGFAGAACGAIVYDLFDPALFPLAKTLQIVSDTWKSRLFARLAVAVLAAAGVVALGEPGSRPIPPAV